VDLREISPQFKKNKEEQGLSKTLKQLGCKYHWDNLNSSKKVVLGLQIRGIYTKN
jgi:hypothetical protein